jgi:large repetitive protein
VTARAAGAPFVVVTPDVEATVLGTRFEVRIDAGRTTVAVRHGRVAVTRRADGERIEVAAGESVVATPDAPLRPAGAAAQMLVHWTFDAAGASLPDAAGHGRDGTLVGVTTAIPGLVGGAWRFAGGERAWLRDPALALGRGSFTVAFWMRSPLTAGNQGIVAKGQNPYNDGGEGWEFRTQGTLLEFARGVGAANVDGGRAPRAAHVIVPDVWTHVAASYDHITGIATLAIDGWAVTSATNPGAYDDRFPLEVGIGRDGSYRGDLDDLRIYGRALSMPEIAEVRRSGRP